MEESTDVRGADPGGERPRTVRSRFDWSEMEPTVAVVEAVAVATNQSPLDVYSLQDAIETEALNELAKSGQDPGVGLRISFSVADCAVTVHGDGLVEVELLN